MFQLIMAVLCRQDQEMYIHMHGNYIKSMPTYIEYFSSTKVYVIDLPGSDSAVSEGLVQHTQLKRIVIFHWETYHC